MKMIAHFTRLLAFIPLVLLTACGAIPQQDLESKHASYVYGYQADSILSNYLAPKETKPDNQSGFFPLVLGHDALLARLALIESAETSLDLQYYIYRNDETSQLLTWRLFEAAERGVRVRLLLDDMQKRDDKGLGYINAHPNIEVRLFNPHHYRSSRAVAFLSDFDRLNRRMHNKSLTADSVASIVGGRNIGNEYFSFESSVEFGDFDVLLYGNTVQEIDTQFDMYWNSDFAIPMEWISQSDTHITQQEVNEWLESSQLDKKFSSGEYDFTELKFYQEMQERDITLYWGEAHLLYDDPSKISGEGSSLVDNLSTLLRKVETSLVLISPYFVPTETGTKELVEAAQSGKEVIIITNSLASNDVFAVHGWYAKYRQDLVEGGVQLWEVKSSANLESSWSMTGSSRSSLHAKAMLLDKDTLFVGSMNWDPRSALLNTEMAVIIEQPEYVGQSYRELDEKLKRNAYQVVIEDGDVAWRDHKTNTTLYTEPNASIWRRMGAWISGILPIEDQL